MKGVNMIIVIGSGPAGISAALYIKRAGLDTAIITNGKSSLFKAEKIENYYGFSGTGKELYEQGIKNAQNVGIDIIYDEVTAIEYENKPIVVTSEKKYDADCVIIATGTSRSAPEIKGIKEFEGKGVSYCAVCDGFFYRGKNVAVIGDGAYAANEVRALVPLASVTVLTNGAEPAAEFECEIKKDKIAYIEGDNTVNAVVFETGEKLPVSGIFIAMGTAGASALAKKLGIITDKNNIKVNEDMSTNVPGIFAAGDCVGGMLQASKAVHDGAAAGMAAIKYIKSLK